MLVQLRIKVEENSICKLELNVIHTIYIELSSYAVRIIRYGWFTSIKSGMESSGFFLYRGSGTESTRYGCFILEAKPDNLYSRSKGIVFFFYPVKVHILHIFGENRLIE